MTNRSPMDSVYRRLQNQGFPPQFVRQFALPEWWNDEAASTPAGLATAMMYIARHLGVSLESMQHPDGVIRLREFGRCKFKKMGRTTEDELAVARAIATRVAHIALTASTGPYTPPPSDPLAIRERILNTADRIDFESLTHYCWEIGIPVLHVSHFPKGRKKMHGLAAIKDGRPAIAISKNEKQAAWMLFILAHELAHIALGHIEEGDVVIDNDSSLQIEEGDAEEQAADRFALHLLRGEAKIAFPGPRWPNAVELARWATCEGKGLGIDPGHLILSYAYSCGDNRYSLARRALEHVQGDFDSVGFLRTLIADRLDWSALPEETSEFFAKMVLDSPHAQSVPSDERISSDESVAV